MVQLGPQAGVQIARCYRGTSGPGQGGGHVRVEEGRGDLRCEASGSGVRGDRFAARVLLADIGGGDRDRRVRLRGQQPDRRRGQRTVTEQGDAGRRGDAENPVDDRTGPGGGGGAEPVVVDALQGAQIGLRVDGRCHAHPLGQRTQPVQPIDRSLFPGAGVGRGVESTGGVVVDHVSAGHRVDRDQQVGVHRQTHGVAQLIVRIDLLVGGELGGGQQRVEASAAAERGRQVVVGEPHRAGAARLPGGQPGPVGQGPQDGHLHRMGRVGRHQGAERLGRVGRRARRHAEHRQQETRVIQTGRRAVVRSAVDVDQQWVHARLVDGQCGLLCRTHRVGEPERRALSALQIGGDGGEVSDCVVRGGILGQRGAQTGRGPHGRSVLEAHHDIVHRAVAHIGHGAGDRHRRLAGGGHQIRGHPVDMQVQKRARRRVRRRPNAACRARPAAPTGR